MATTTFGSVESIKTDDVYIKELQDLVGVNFPISLTTYNGDVVHFEYETEWKDGGTTPVEAEVEVEKTIINEEGEEETILVTETQIVDYTEDYEEKELTPTQITKINQWAADNVVGA